MKDGVTYNKPGNEVFVRSEGDLIYVICSKEKQTDNVVSRMTTKNCKLVGYEEWDEGEDMKWILKFAVLDEYDIEPELN